MDYNINEYWEKTKIWYYNVKPNKNIFPNKKYTDKNRNKFISKKNKLFSKIFFNIDIEDNYNILYYIDILLNNLNFNNIKHNLLNNENEIINFFNFDKDLKKTIIFLSKYTKYYNSVLNKIRTILNPILNESNLFKTDDDTFRIIAPIFFVFTYIYMNNRDLINTINIFLDSDIIFIQFFIISYLILDDIMDDNLINENDKNIFMEWFIDIINNPNIQIIIPSNTLLNNLLLHKCSIFKKYFEYFINKYNTDEHMYIYKYVKYMIYILKESNDQQQNKNINEEKILEYSFKKSFAVSYFLMYFVDKHSNKDTIENISKLILLSQLIDDYSDIDKDNLENIYTYFNSSHINISFEDRIKKVIYASYDYIKVFNDKNNDINNLINVFTKYNLYPVILLHYKKLKINMLNDILEYIIIPKELIIKLIDSNQNNDNIIILYLKKYLTQIQ